MTVGDILNSSFVGNNTDVRLALFSLTAAGASVDILTGTKATPAITAHAGDVLADDDYYAFYPAKNNIYIRLGE